MLKTKLKTGITLAAMCLIFSSCYTYTSVVGKGPQGSETVTRHNHYLIDGLVTIKTSDSKAMAGEVKDYSVTTQHTFIDGLLSLITFGIYSPTTTTVTK